MTNVKAFRRLSVVVVAILLITMSLLSVTLAKYTTEIELNGKVTAATFSVTAEGNAQDKSLDLVPTDYTNVADGKIAPGTTGSFVVTVTNNSEVAVDYDIELAANTEFANAIAFYTNAECTTPFDGTNKSLALPTSGDGTTASYTIYWKWNDAQIDNDGTNADNALAGDELTVTVTVTAEQAAPAATPAA